jgi:membrane-associated phospholipid phosphatase
MLSDPYSLDLAAHIGALSLQGAMMALVCAGLMQAGAAATLSKWLLAFVIATAVTLATKIAFFGWGIGSVALDFTGISGHTLLATSVLPMLGWVFARRGEAYSRPMVLVGLALGAFVGAWRVAIDAHSVSEVVSGWIGGAAVAVVALRALRPGWRAPMFVKLVPLLFLISPETIPNLVSSPVLEAELAIWLSGREAPYTRQWLHRPHPQATKSW